MLQKARLGLGNGSPTVHLGCRIRTLRLFGDWAPGPWLLFRDLPSLDEGWAGGPALLPPVGTSTLCDSPHPLGGSPQLEGGLPGGLTHARKGRRAKEKPSFPVPSLSLTNLNLQRLFRSARHSGCGSVLCRHQIRVESSPFPLPLLLQGLQR